MHSRYLDNSDTYIELKEFNLQAGNKFVRSSFDSAVVARYPLCTIYGYDRKSYGVFTVNLTPKP